MIQRTLSALLFLSLLCTCGPSPEKGAEAETTADAAPAPTATYPSIPVERLEHLFNNATYMDATFYTLPISMNQSEVAQIQSTLGTVAAEPAVVPAGASPIGHIWFQIDGKNIEEADIYFQSNIAAYVWYENGKPAYSNKLTQAGIEFYNNVISSVPPQ
jgi:hypothetical protein